MSSFWLILKQQWTIKISSPLFFLFLAWRPSWLEVGITGHNFGRGPSKVWLQLAQWFLRRRLKCEMLTNGLRTKSDDNSSPGPKARWAKNQVNISNHSEKKAVTTKYLAKFQSPTAVSCPKIIQPEWISNLICNLWFYTLIPKIKSISQIIVK